jgi:hypothetical protein
LARQLEALAHTRGIDVEISEVDSRIVVTVDGSSELTGGAAILGQVFSLLSGSLSSGLVVYSYTLAELDEARAALIWEAATAVASFPPPELKTLAPIASGAVDVERHCNVREGAVRLVVRNDELIRRQARRDPDARANRVLLSVDDPIVLFLGAGASASARIPQGNWLRDVSLANLTGLPNTSDELVAAFWQYLEDRPTRFLVDEATQTLEQFERGLTLERALREEFHQLSGRPRSEAPTVGLIADYCARALDRNPRGREAIHELAAVLPRLIIGTVNFDQLIESDMTIAHEVFASIEDFARAPDLIAARLRGESDVVPVMKVHGTIEAPDTIVADIDKTSRGLPREVVEALNAIVDNVERVTWVWVGCSMRDLDLRQWLGSVQASKVVEYWVDPLPPKSVADYAWALRRIEWATSGEQLEDRQITESSDIFLPLLRERARELTS